VKDLEKENARLKRLIADAELDKAILREAASGCRRRAQLTGVSARGLTESNTFE
jgi:regulator of extracellular matrix RemA (YlzA/DUF370 family)